MTCGNNDSSAIRGDQALMGFENSSCDVTNGGLTPDVYGTAVDFNVFTEAKICCEITPEFSSEEIEGRTIGCGGTTGFGTKCDAGKREYRVNLTGDLGFQTGFDRILAQAMGTVVNSGEVTAGQGDFCHIFSWNGDWDRHFGTLSFQITKNDIIELPSTFVESFSISMDSLDSYITWNAKMVANDMVCDGTETNDLTDLDALAFTDDESVIARCESYFLIKPVLDDGTDTALDPLLDKFAITNFELSVEKPHEVIAEMTGDVCNEPSQAGKPSGTFTIGIKELVSNSFLSFCDWKDNITYQAELVILGEQINGGVNKEIRIRFPKLCMVETPTYGLADAGLNSYQVAFKVLDSNNTIPNFTSNGFEIVICNQRSTDYLV